jgi:putative ABC transport system permease protein
MWAPVGYDRTLSYRFVMRLLELLAGIALLMTAIGLYGVLAYSVSERTREIGIRAALGASRREIMQLVLGAGLSVVVAGLALGVTAAIGVTRYLQDSLYAVSATDPGTFVSVIGVLFAVAVVAQIVPIFRAVHVDPAIALRQE